MAFCCRCKEEFTLADKEGWAMGQMRKVRRLPRRLAQRFHEWRDHPEGGWICGNCYFDLTDEE